MTALAGLLVDVAPLRRSPAFRRLWIGSAFSAVGSQMTTFAVALQVYRLTHSSAAVGTIGLVAAIPAVCSGLFGGALIDTVDRRRLVLLTSSLLAAVSTGFAAQAFAGLDRLWLLYLLIGAQATVASVNGPARRTFMPRLLPPEQIPAGAALTTLAGHLSLFLGPVLAGLVAASGGVQACYLVDALSFLAALYGVARLPAMRPVGQVPRPGLRGIADGLRFLRRSRVLTAALLADLNATVLAMPIALFPAINAERFGGSAGTLGLFPAALAIGGLLGSGLSGPVGRIARPGRGMLAAGAIWGLATAGFGLADGLTATLGSLVVAGAADASSVVLRATIIQTATPDAYLGRVTATDFIVGASMPEIGNFRAGVFATLGTPTLSAVSGGLAAAGGTAVLALAFPALTNYRSRPRVDLPAPA